MLTARLNRRIRTLPQRTRGFFILGSSGLALLVAPLGCSSDESGDEETLPPPELVIVGAQNTDGETFDKDDEVVRVPCDARVTIRLGPSSDGGGLLDNWFWRGPLSCPAKATQCGFVQLNLLNGDEETVETLTQATLNPVIDGSKISLVDVREVVATLISSQDNQAFLVDGAPVTDNWTVRFETDPACEMGMGGVGGDSGSGGMPGIGGEEPMGGLGGLSDE
jgi:hypothetical protein